MKEFCSQMKEFPGDESILCTNEGIFTQMKEFLHRWRNFYTDEEIFTQMKKS